MNNGQVPNLIKGPTRPPGYTGVRPWVKFLGPVFILALIAVALFSMGHGLAIGKQSGPNIHPASSIAIVSASDIAPTKPQRAPSVKRAAPRAIPSAPVAPAAESVAPSDTGAGNAGTADAAASAAAAAPPQEMPTITPVRTPSPAEVERELQAKADRDAISAPLAQASAGSAALVASAPTPVPSPAHGYWLRRGMVINATLYTSIDTTVPGLIIAYIGSDVYDFTHRVVVVPRGGKMIGSYGTTGIGIAQGQARIPVAFDEVQLGDRVMALDAEPGVDRTGTSGLGVRVDSHTRAAFEAFTVLAATALLTKSNNCTNCQQSGSSAGSTVLQAGVPLLPKANEIAPTGHSSEGAAIAILLTHDIEVKPWFEAR